jgi:hypothetical protein
VSPNGSAAKTINVRLYPKPVVEQGVAYKNGVTYFPKSRQFILPPVVVKGSLPKHKHNMVPKSSLKLSAAVNFMPRFQLTRPKLGQSLPHHRIGLHTPKLHLNPGLTAAVRAQKLIATHSRLPSPMRLQPPKLGMHRPSFSTMHRAPAVRGFRR